MKTIENPPTKVQLIRKHWKVTIVLTIVIILSVWDVVRPPHHPQPKAVKTLATYRQALRECDHVRIIDGKVYASGCR